MEPIEYVRALIRRWQLIAVGALVGALFAFFGTDPKPPPVQVSYTASNTLLVSTPTDLGNQTRIGTITFAQIPLFAKRGEVPRRVAEKLEFDGAPAALAAQVEVFGNAETKELVFSTVGNDPQNAVDLANAFADETVRYLTERQQEQNRTLLAAITEREATLRIELEELDRLVDPDARSGQATERAQRDAVSREYSLAFEELRRIRAANNDVINLTPLESAQALRQETGGFQVPRTRRQRVPLAASVGALLGAGLALLVERLDARVRDRRRAELSMESSVLTEIPTLTRKQRGRRMVVGPTHRHAAAEAFRSLRTSLTFLITEGEPLPPDEPIGVILVTSPSPSEGKTTTVLNLAAAYAETGRSVILVNADFRRPALTAAVLGEEVRPPLPGGLQATDRHPARDFLVPTATPGVELLDLAPMAATPGDLTRATVRMINELRQSTDIILVDTPPLGVTTEALDFVPVAEVVLLIARVGRTNSDSAKRAAELIRFAGARRVGIALTAAGAPRVRNTKYYGYYDTPAAKPTRRAKRAQAAEIVPAAEPVTVPAGRVGVADEAAATNGGGYLDPGFRMHQQRLAELDELLARTDDDPQPDGGEER